MFYKKKNKNRSFGEVHFGHQKSFFLIPYTIYYYSLDYTVATELYRKMWQLAKKNCFIKKVCFIVKCHEIHKKHHFETLFHSCAIVVVVIAVCSYDNTTKFSPISKLSIDLCSKPKTRSSKNGLYKISWLHRF